MPDPRFPVPATARTPAPGRDSKDEGLTASEGDEGQSLRPSTPVCPRCGINLQGVKHATGIAWRCDACGGQSLNFSQFRRMVPGAHVDEIWVTTTAQPVSAPRRTRCPECRCQMTAVLVPASGREIELDICRRCQRLWLENQENISKTLEGELRNPLSRPGPPGGPRPPVIRMTSRQMDDQAHQDFQERLLRARMFTRGDRRSGLRPSTVVAVLALVILLWLTLKRH